MAKKNLLLRRILITPHNCKRRRKDNISFHFRILLLLKFTPSFQIISGMVISLIVFSKQRFGIFRSGFIAFYSITFR
jgi:hypothetical protein